MAGYNVTQLARDDLTALWMYIAHDRGPRSADHFDRTLHAAMMTIGRLPRIGRARPDFGDGVRILTDHGVVIVYRAEPSPVLVLRVLHGSRDVGAILGRRERQD